MAADVSPDEGEVRSVTGSDVAMVRWPGEEHRLERLRAERRPRLLLVESGAAPPLPADDLEDWIRVPAHEVDMMARLAGLERRYQENGSVRPEVGEDGVLRMGRNWVSLPPVDHRLAARAGRALRRGRQPRGLGQGGLARGDAGSQRAGRARAAPPTTPGAPGPGHPHGAFPGLRPGAGRATGERHGMIRRAFFLAGLVVVLLALGPFAAPLTDEVATSVVDVQVDHRNDVPVVQPSRPESSHLATEPPVDPQPARRRPGGGPAAGGGRGRRRHTAIAAVARPPSWSRPPHRGPPLLAAG